MTKHPFIADEGGRACRAKASFSSGMVGLLEPVVKELDTRSAKILESQKVLLDRVEGFSSGSLPLSSESNIGWLCVSRWRFGRPTASNVHVAAARIFCNARVVPQK